MATEAAKPYAVDLGAVRPSYRNYVLIVLFAVCTLNFLDRQIIVILTEPIKREFQLPDWQLGALSGLAFALLYSFLGVPLARIADRGHRVAVITVSLAVWSVFTFACGLAQNFAQLATARMVVGMGEAGGGPPAQSLVVDYSLPNKRASAMAVYLLGIPIGSLLGQMIGGAIVEPLGWREAFMVAGIPGVLLAILAAFSLKEPAVVRAPRSTPTTREALKEILATRSFVLLTMAGASVTFVNYGQAAFFPSFMLRNHSADLTHLAALINASTGTHMGPIAALGSIYGVCMGISGITSVLVGGQLTDLLVARDKRAYINIQIASALLRVPCLLLAMLAPSGGVALLALAAQSFMQGLGGAASFAAVPSLVRPQNRATALAIWMFALNAVGLGLGPVCIGGLSDLFAMGFGSGAGLGYALISSELVLVVAAGELLSARSSFVRESLH